MLWVVVRLRPLTGIRASLTMHKQTHSCKAPRVSVPLRGFVLL